MLLGLLLVGGASAAAGWGAGRSQMHATATMQTGLYMLEQYNLALQDMEAGRYDLAYQRLEYVYRTNPNFLEVAEKFLEVVVIMQSTQATASAPVVPTATPTPDPRPKEELFLAAQAAFAARDWNTVIDTLLALRKADPAYRTADADGMFYAALRNRGVAHITQLGLFEPGLYDFALAEKFGPLDAQAGVYREWARLYLYGNAFWLAYPAEASYYYGLLVNQAPDLRDSEGLTAFYRYWQSLLHWGDKLANEEDWCGAAERYQQAMAARPDASVQPTAEFAGLQCLGPSETPTPTATPTGSTTPTPTGTLVSDTPTPALTLTPETPSPEP